MKFSPQNGLVETFKRISFEQFRCQLTNNSSRDEIKQFNLDRAKLDVDLI